VRAYLLGALDDLQASRLEEKYFKDPAALSRIRQIEDSLIDDYLRGRLSAPEKEGFEARYLTVPVLRKRLDEVRFRMRAAPKRSLPVVWFRHPYALALVALFAIALAGAYYRHRVSQAGVSPLAGAVAPARIAALNILLMPGVAKGAGAESAEFRAQSMHTPIRLTMELPGRSAPSDYVIQVFSVDAEGHQQLVWTSHPLRSSRNADSGRVTAELDSGILPPADYVVHVDGPDGVTQESYLFRVIRP
jgi:hypothetical protein